MYQGPSGTQWLQLYRAATAVENCSSIYHYIMYMPRIYLYVFITLSKFKTYLMACLVNRFHKTVNKIFKSEVVIFRVILLDQLNILVRGVPYHCVVFSGKNFTLTMSLPTQEFIWVYTGELSCREAGWNAGELPGNVVINWHPIQGRVVTFHVASCYVETGISSGYMGHLISSNTNLTFFNDTCYYMANES